MTYKNLKDNEININGFTVVKENVSLDFLIANKIIKNEMNDAEEYDIFIGDEILDSVYLGADDKIYYLRENGDVYSYTQEMHTLKNECNKYPV